MKFENLTVGFAVTGSFCTLKKTICHIEDLKRDTGFEPQVDFETGIKNTVEWYKMAFLKRGEIQ